MQEITQSFIIESYNNFTLYLDLPPLADNSFIFPSTLLQITTINDNQTKQDLKLT